MAWQRRGLRRIGGVFYPRRLYVQDHFEDVGIERALMRARCLEVRVTQLDPSTFRFRGGRGKVDITTTTPQLLTWEDLGINAP